MWCIFTSLISELAHNYSVSHIDSVLSSMDPRDRSVIDRHFPRLQQCFEPTKLLRHLETVGVIDEDDVETIREEKTKSSRETQVAVFVDIMKRRENGFRYFLQALLKSKVQDFLARELLEDDVYDEEGEMFSLKYNIYQIYIVFVLKLLKLVWSKALICSRFRLIYGDFKYNLTGFGSVTCRGEKK